MEERRTLMHLLEDVGAFALITALNQEEVFHFSKNEIISSQSTGFRQVFDRQFT